MNKYKIKPEKKKGIIGLWIDKQVENVHAMFGGPSNATGRKWILLLGGVIYLAIGIWFCISPTNLVMVWLGVQDPTFTLFIGVITIIGGSLLFAYWMFVVSIRMKEKNVKNKFVILLYGIAVLILYLFYLVKQIIFWFLRKTGQINVIAHLPEIIASVFITFFVMVFLIAKDVVGLLTYKISGVLLWSELLAFVYVFLAIVMIFGVSKWFICGMIKIEIRSEQKYRLKKNSTTNLRGVMKKSDIKDERKREYINQKKELDKELKNSVIWFFVVVNIILLIAPIKDEIGELFVYEFMGITTLFALTREVQANIKETLSAEEEKKSI